MSSTPRLVLSETIDLPVVEASGVAVRRTERGSVVLVVGDRTAEVGACVIGDGGELDDWTVLDLAELPGWPLPPGDSQFDAIAADGGSLGNLWLLSDKSQRVGRLDLDDPLAPDDDEVRDLDEVWDLPDGAIKPEGIAALGDGRVLVALDTGSTTGNGMIVIRPD